MLHLISEESIKIKISFIYKIKGYFVCFSFVGVERITALTYRLFVQQSEITKKREVYGRC